jgi:small subunit ribosomal protein S16
MLIFSHMLKIRLKRVGRKNDPSYRVVVVPSTTGPKSGNVIEVVGNYDPRRDIKEVNAERVKHWMGQGAQVSDTVHNILVSKQVIEGKKRNALPKKTPIKKEVVEEEPKAEAPAAAVEEAAEAPAPEAIAEGVTPAAEEVATEIPAKSQAPEETPAEEPIAE